MRADVYSLDGKTLAAIKSERGTIEVAGERPRVVSNTPTKPVRMQQPLPQRTSSFFEQLFGGQQASRQPPAPVPQRRMR
jgi:hypothetical protein